MGSVVTSKRAAKSWMYSDGAFQVFFSCAFHHGAGLKGAPSIANDLFPIIADSLAEWWPCEYKVQAGGALNYLDLDNYPADELRVLEQAMAAAVSEIEAGRFALASTWSANVRAKLLQAGRELLEIIRAAVEYATN